MKGTSSIAPPIAPLTAYCQATLKLGRKRTPRIVELEYAPIRIRTINGFTLRAMTLTNPPKNTVQAFIIETAEVDKFFDLRNTDRQDVQGQVITKRLSDGKIFSRVVSARLQSIYPVVVLT